MYKLYTLFRLNLKKLPILGMTVIGQYLAAHQQQPAILHVCEPCLFFLVIFLQIDLE